MKTLSALKAEVDADIEKQLGEMIDDRTAHDTCHEIADNNVPNSDREVIEVFHSDHSLGDATDFSDGANSVLEWLRANIEQALRVYACEEFDRQKEEYEDMRATFEEGGCKAMEDINFKWTIYKPNPQGIDQLHAGPKFNTEYEAWKAFEKEQA